jgi:hypothetical protein
MNDEKSGMKIALLTSQDPQDRRSWSGAIYRIAQALQKYCGDVTYIGPLGAFYERLIGFALRSSSKFLLKKTFVCKESFLIAKRYAKATAQKIALQAFDVIVAPTGAPEVAFLETDIPIVLVADSTYALLLDYYPEFSNVLKR